jgi:hypothetical protein
METETPRLFYEVFSVGHEGASTQEMVYCQFNHSGPDSAGAPYIVHFPVGLRHPVFGKSVARMENENEESCLLRN